MPDIIDEIDQLVDEQMAGGEPIGGFDYNDPDFPKCPHCDRDFHGIPLTERILEMRHRTGWDENYRVDTDDSPMVCEGSLFIGPVRPQRIRVSAVTIGRNPSAPWVFFSEQVYEDSVLSASVVGEMIRSANLYAYECATEVLAPPRQSVPREYQFERAGGMIQGVIDTLTTLGLFDPVFAMENLLPEVPNLPVLRPSYLPAVIGE
ncbi:hypothetical protein [Mycobacteroides chelonae]|uniref:Uncharacterized protein n=1 Tax=Mycobacteroides chelonae TaxID=1774 RepID=A0AB73U5N8_MYCCH|nr:hypothetical protein [Mycobacteroides chelonae]QDF72344.1 hypothetical protein FJK96_20730 [Mycobacteroides chelonae]